MMRSRGLAGAAAVFAAAVGLTAAGPAVAQPAAPIQGMYTYHEDGAPTATWRLYPTCTPMGCSILGSMVVPNTSDEKAGQFRLTNNLWTTSFPVPRGLTCPDGSTAEIQETYSFDSVTLAGTHTRSNAEVCGGKVAPALTKTPFTLTFDRPLDVPIDQHPLHCNDPWHCSA